MKLMHLNRVKSKGTLSEAHYVILTTGKARVATVVEMVEKINFENKVFCLVLLFIYFNQDMMRPICSEESACLTQCLDEKSCADSESGSSAGTFVMQPCNDYIVFGVNGNSYRESETKVRVYRRLLHCCILFAVPSRSPVMRHAPG